LELIRWKYPTAANEERPFARFVDLSRRYFNALGVVDFSEIRCDLPGEGSFLAAVYRACRQIPYGTTISYGELARRIGRDGAARAVARAMSSNPLPLVVPCHRVIYSDGRAGGFSAEAGPSLKQRLLELESRIHRSSS
ncbi:MAG: methylated-DNA--[protein]-cysteine S-methyltransferase, partial [Planctomycetota bacterium]